MIEGQVKFKEFKLKQTLFSKKLMKIFRLFKIEV